MKAYAMNAADAALVRIIRRELSKRPIESARVDVQALQGRVTLAGVVTRLRDKPDVDLKNELDHVQKQIMRDRSVKEVSVNVRIIEKVEEKEDHSRDRMRH